MYLLENVLRHYAWGSRTAIAGLLGREPSGNPEAELWVGAHPDSPSTTTLPDASRVGLDTLIAADPQHMVGSGSAARYGARLPYLLKVLAAGESLSLQVHPSLEQAAAGFAAENAAGIPVDSPGRNYRDANHKPEMILALTAFEALCGFRPLAEAAAVFDQLRDCSPGAPADALLAEIGSQLRRGTASALQEAFTRLLAVDAGVVQSMHDAAARALGRTPDSSAMQVELRTVVELGSQHPGDPGVLLALLLNRVALQPGEVIYLPAGNIHAYLSGLGIEVMASSDNVLRGGLTPKHVDTAELLRTVVFEPLAPPSLRPETTALGQELYCPPFGEFQLQRIELAAGTALDSTSADVPLVQNGPVVIVVLAGSLLLDSPAGDLRLDRGQSAFIPAGEAPVMVRPARPGQQDPGQQDPAHANANLSGGNTTVPEPALAFAVTVGSV